ncbi:MAG: ATP-dependent helicase [candidate division FCPU426 bacterium]
MDGTEKLRVQILNQGPTTEQCDAIFADDLEFLLRAAPGSGKTWTSCRRFIWRGANWSYNVGGLALLSFTNAAIREFHEATIKVGQRGLLSDPNYVGTFDSFVERFIITPFGHLICGSVKRPKLFIAPRPGDWANTKLQAWTKTKRGTIPVPAWEIIPFPDNLKVAFRASDKFGGQTLEFRENHPVEEFFKYGYYTHAQRVYLACRILFERPHIAECIARRFPEIVVDEAQDTNAWLLILLNFIRDKGTKITLVGDPDQCIYEFSMADATSLPALKKKWNIPEKPLSKSFRCNNRIAESVKNISGNISFVGCGGIENEYHHPFIVREPSSGFGKSIAEFERLLNLANIPLTRSAILCRAHQQLETIRGDVNYISLQGLTKDMAQAAFYRDTHKDYRKAQHIVENSIRQMIDEPNLWEEYDENPDSNESHRIKLALWKFTKSPEGLPLVSENCEEWIEKLKTNLSSLFTDIGITNLPKLGLKIKRTGIDAHKLTLPLFQPQTLFPRIRQETIHKVKGESIDGVLVLGSAQFFNAVLKAIESNTNNEERRLAYVAMTRARHLLLVGLPASHYDKHLSSWVKWGFKTI